MFINVDFPAPFSPSKAWISPSFTEMDVLIHNNTRKAFCDPSHLGNVHELSSFTRHSATTKTWERNLARWLAFSCVHLSLYLNFSTNNLLFVIFHFFFVRTYPFTINITCVFFRILIELHFRQELLLFSSHIFGQFQMQQHLRLMTE